MNSEMITFDQAFDLASRIITAGPMLIEEVKNIIESIRKIQSYLKTEKTLSVYTYSPNEESRILQLGSGGGIFKMLFEALRQHPELLAMLVGLFTRK